MARATLTTKTAKTPSQTRKPKAAARKPKAASAPKAAAASATTGAKITRSASPAVAPPASKPTPVIVQTNETVVSGPQLKKKELIDLVAERSGEKRKSVKPAIEAALAVLGQALAEGRELNLQPLGKVKVNRTKDVSGGRVIIVKVRQSDRSKEPKAPLPKAAE